MRPKDSEGRANTMTVCALPLHCTSMIRMMPWIKKLCLAETIVSSTQLEVRRWELARDSPAHVNPAALPPSRQSHRNVSAPLSYRHCPPLALQAAQSPTLAASHSRTNPSLSSRL